MHEHASWCQWAGRMGPSVPCPVRDIGRPGQVRHWLDFLADVFTLTGTSQRIGWQISLIWREYGPGNSWVLS